MSLLVCFIKNYILYIYICVCVHISPLCNGKKWPPLFNFKKLPTLCKHKNLNLDLNAISQ